MTNRISGVVIAGALLAGASAAGADELGGLEFDTVDANADGFVTLEEIQTVAPRAEEARFDVHDADDDGRLDRTEYEAWLTDFVGRG